jgi:hypothetical protein
LTQRVIPGETAPVPAIFHSTFRPSGKSSLPLRMSAP